MTTPIKCVSLWQPWASFIAHDLKHVETRSWPAPTSILGTRIGIHAAKTRDGILATSCESILSDSMRQIEEEHGPLPFGAIVATAVVEACIPVERLKADPFGDYTPGRYGWILTDIEKLAVPVACRGAQGIFFADVDLGREWCQCENPGPHFHPGNGGKFCAVCGKDIQKRPAS